MSNLGFLWVTVVETLLRVLPFPCRTGLRRIGTPGRGAPVLLTCNFRLTVERVRRALRGVDAYLLVANSRGVNVWCAATGGLLTDHDVISVLKTSGIEELVDHRRVILPQLAATGIDGGAVRKRTGWRVVWGPVAASAIPAFLEAGMKATTAMRTVRFPWPQRLEMAVAWAFPLSMVAAGVLAPWWRGGVLPVVGLVWALALALFASFPLYRRRLARRPPRRHHGFVLFDLGERGLPVALWLLTMAAVIGAHALAGRLSWGVGLRWGVASLMVVLVLSLDLTGSTPTFKSGLHPDRLLAIALEEDRCTGAALCEQVCPVDVFVIDRRRHLATLPRAERCVQCGACVVQCPADALFFRGAHGEVVTPETVRRFKLNLLGHRAVDAGRRH